MKVVMRTVRRGGLFYRVADADWENPLDGSFSMRRGGRWNARGSFPLVYLNATVDVARAQVQRSFDGAPWTFGDLDPGPVLVSTEVAYDEYVDVVTDEGCMAAGLPAAYPKGVDHARCQPIGQRAWGHAYPGIACRSAAVFAPGGGEELAWFQRPDRDRLRATQTEDFDEWF